MKEYQIKRLLSIIILFLLIVVSLYYKENIYTPKVNIKTTIQNKEIVDQNLIVYFIDVGEADSILINSNNEYALIDAGNTIDGNKLKKYFKSLGITNFKYVFGTHAHEDHIGGMSNIIYNFNIEKYFMNNVPSDYKSYHNVLKALNKRNLEITHPNNDEELPLGEGVIKVIYNGNDEEDLNASSIVLELTYKNTKYLFTADSTKEVEEKIIDKYDKVNVLKVSHHGSNDASSANFLVKIHPEYAIISVGKNNDYHHPHQVTLNKLERIGSKVYRTDLEGTIILTSDGENIKIESEKTDTNGE